MQLGWNGASSMKADLETDIEIARRVGYPLLEIWGAKLRHYLQRHTVTELADRLKAANIRLTTSQNRFRVSVSVFNDMNDIDRLLEALPKSPPA